MLSSIKSLSVLIFLPMLLMSQVDYNFNIQPIFDTTCTGCHGNSGGLNLSSYADLMDGGDSGPVIDAENHANSLLWQKVDNGSMPPGNNPDLSSEQINLIAQWITEGASEIPLSTKYENEIHPNQISIIQNYPNPFNPVTHFLIFSPIQQSGKVSIINFAGQKMIDLGIVHLNPGKQTFVWNPQSFTNLSSGQYLFCLKSNDLITTRKFSFIK